jgi:hypothetical protein
MSEGVQHSQRLFLEADLQAVLSQLPGTEIDLIGAEPETSWRPSHACHSLVIGSSLEDTTGMAARQRMQDQWFAS